jgi:hypothetical protein
MFRLACTVAEGVFSNERLVRFMDAQGEEYTALVDVGRVFSEGGRGWLEVASAGGRDSETLIALPTADGARVWVPSDALQPAG